MSEYHNDPSYGRDDYGSTCMHCGDWIDDDYAIFCSPECETALRDEIFAADHSKPEGEQQ
jgi:hypothetical protein